MGATTNITGATALANTRTWNNGGSVSMVMGGHNSYLDIATGALLNNLSSGVIDLRSATINTGFSGAGTINNAGELKKTLNTSVQEVFIDPVFNNQATGTVNHNSGLLRFDRGGTDAGNYTVASGATLQFNGGTRSISGNVIGAGNVSFTGSTVNYDLTGAYSIGGITTASFAHNVVSTLDFTGTTSLGTSYVQEGNGTTVTFQASADTNEPDRDQQQLRQYQLRAGTTFPAVTTLSKTQAGTLDFANSNLNLTSYTQTAGVVTGSGTITIPSGGTFNWGGGTLGGTGTLSTPVGATTNITGATALANTRTWNNGGSVSMVMGGHNSYLDILGALLNNLSSGVIDLRSATINTGFKRCRHDQQCRGVEEDAEHLGRRYSSIRLQQPGDGYGQSQQRPAAV
ncbi:MAG: hypothetical protein IPP41_04290 [Rhodocyclaceae bacterium]|nr:hypothetical protein [Rhodocyclaceae bacterium]